MTDGELKIHSDTAWKIASQLSWAIGSDTRTIATQIDSALSEARATGRREGMEEAAEIAEEPITYTFPDGSPAVTRPRPDGTTIAAAIRAAMEKA